MCLGLISVVIVTEWSGLKHESSWLRISSAGHKPLPRCFQPGGATGTAWPVSRWDNGNLSDLAAGLAWVERQLEIPPPPTPILDPLPTVPVGPLHPCEPYVPAPEHYDGNLGDCKSFLFQCSLVFELQPLRFASSDPSNCQLRLRQGSLSAANYAVEFRTLATELGWDDKALQSIFMRGLNEAVKDSIVGRAETSDL